VSTVVELWGLRLQSLSNQRLHWADMSAQKKKQRIAVRWALVGKVVPLLNGETAEVQLHRIGKRQLDDDNLGTAFKAVRDEVAAALGRDDGPKAPIKWSYSQEQGKEYGIRITITVKERE
jgi:hypothetical protein